MSQRQLAMVIDLNKCLGCQTCTLACKTLWTDHGGMEYMYWNNVETKPGLGYPRDWERQGGGFDVHGRLQLGALPDTGDYGIPWEYNYEELATGEARFLRPSPEPSWGPNWEEDVGAGQFPNSYYFYLPRLCNHCAKPACLPACPRQAIYKREEDGIVLIDQERCLGYRLCARACPYKKPLYNATVGKSQKCIFCYPRLEKRVAPACSRQCVGRARFVSFLDEREGPAHQLVYVWKVALPLHPEYGTEPNVFYVPPTSPPTIGPDGRVTDQPRVPLSYLESLFGPGAGPALDTLVGEMEKARNGQASDLLVLLQGRTERDRFQLPTG